MNKVQINQQTNNNTMFTQLQLLHPPTSSVPEIAKCLRSFFFYFWNSIVIYCNVSSYISWSSEPSSQSCSLVTTGKPIFNTDNEPLSHVVWRLNIYHYCMACMRSFHSFLSVTLLVAKDVPQSLATVEAWEGGLRCYNSPNWGGWYPIVTVVLVA